MPDFVATWELSKNNYWIPTGGAITPQEQKMVSGFVDFLCELVGRAHPPALSDAAEQYLHEIATTRTGDIAQLNSFAAFREWVTIQVGFFYPDGYCGRRAKSIAFSNSNT